MQQLGGIVVFVPASPLPAHESGRISGLVTASGTDGALSEAQVYRPELGGFAVSDSGGRYQTPDVPAGTYNVRLEPTGYRSAGRPVTVVSGETFIADFMLERLASGSGSPPHFPSHHAPGAARTRGLTMQSPPSSAIPRGGPPHSSPSSGGTCGLGAQTGPCMWSGREDPRSRRRDPSFRLPRLRPPTLAGPRHPTP